MGQLPTSSRAWRIWFAQLRLQRSFDHSLWRRLTDRFPSVLHSMTDMDVGPWVTPLWEQFNARMLEAVTPVPPRRFLRESVIRKSMFVDIRGQWLADQMDIVRSHWGDQLERLATESPVGDPPLCDPDLMTSHNTIHHLSHLARFEQSTGVKVSEMRTVLEWGGGFGNLARLTLGMASADARYVVVDTPLFCAVQWLYLSMVLGVDSVEVWQGEGVWPDQRVVIVPVPAVGKLDFKPELFISTWALSESSPYAQDFVAQQRDWFDAERLLLGFQESNEQLPDAGRIEGIAKQAGCTIEPVRVIEANHYAFR